MTDLRLSEREVDDVLAGRQPDGRADLAGLAEVAAVLHASREVEPPPPISDALRNQIARGVPRPAVPARRRHQPRHMKAVAPRRNGLATYRRPVVSLAAAATILIGLIVATSGRLPGDVHSAVADVGSAIGLDVFRRDDAAQPDTSMPTTSSTSTTTTTIPPTTAPPNPTTTAPPPTTQAPVGPAPAEPELPWWLSPEVWQQWGLGDWSGGGGQWDGHSRGGNHQRDGDRDGDGDGRGAGSGYGDGRHRTARPDGGTSSTQPPTTASPTSTSTSPASPTTAPPPTTA